MSYGKLRNREVFRATVNGKEYVFTCYTQYCGTHVRELCCEGFSDTTESKWIKRDIIGKDIWYNRPWYEFRYANALRRGIENLSESVEVKEKLKAILIDKTAQEEHERCEKEFQAFEALFNKTSDTFKQAVANSNLIMNSDEDVSMVKSLMALDIVLNS